MLTTFSLNLLVWDSSYRYSGDMGDQLEDQNILDVSGEGKGRQADL